MSKSGNDETVGYRRPPKGSRFKPGQSGNLKGRPAGAKGSRTIWDEELKATVGILENGKAKRISKRRAMVRQAVNKAAGGDMKAVTFVETVTREHEAAAENASLLGAGVFDRPADAATIASIFERVKRSVLETVVAEAATATLPLGATEAAASTESASQKAAVTEAGADTSDSGRPSDGGPR